MVSISVWVYLYRFRTGVNASECTQCHHSDMIMVAAIRKRACCAPPWVIHGIYSPVPTRVHLRLFCSIPLYLFVPFFLPRSSVPKGLLSPSSYFRFSSRSLLSNAQPFFRPHSTICEERAVEKHVFYACSYRLFRYQRTFPRDMPHKK